MEGPTSPGGLRSRITRLTLREHDDDDDDENLIIRADTLTVQDIYINNVLRGFFTSLKMCIYLHI
jgi:hypothetical protein